MAYLTVKEVVQEFCRRTGFTVPSTVVSSTDPRILQMVALLNEEIEEVTRREQPLQALLLEATFVAAATEDQGNINTLAGQDVRFILNNVLWNRNTKLPLFGPLTPSQWQQFKAQVQTGPLNQYRIRANKLLMIPVPTAGHTIAFEFVPINTVVATGGTLATKRLFSVDTDFCLIPDELLIAALRWRIKAEKGLKYAEDFRRYENLLGNLVLRDGTKGKLNLQGDCMGVRPGIFVPAGNWPIP